MNHDYADKIGTTGGTTEIQRPNSIDRLDAELERLAHVEYREWARRDEDRRMSRLVHRNLMRQTGGQS